MTRSRLVVIGTGGLGRETVWALQGANATLGVDPIGFVTSDSRDHGKQISGLPVLGDESWLVGREDVTAVCCIGNPRARMRVVAALAGEGVEFASVVHPTALISPAVELAAGAIVGARAVITTQVRVGRNAIVGVGAIVSHDCVIGDFGTLAPGVMLAGHVQVERAAELGIGVSVRPRQTIGRGALVGAGSVVAADVAANTVVAGTPAAYLRDFESAEAV